MPIIKINTKNEITKSKRKNILDSIYEVIPASINASLEGLKVLISEYEEGYIYSIDAQNKEKNFVYIQVNMWKGRTAQQKKDMCFQITKIISEQLDIDKNEIWISIDEFDKCNWSKGGTLCDMQ